MNIEEEEEESPNFNRDEYNNYVPPSTITTLCTKAIQLYTKLQSVPDSPEKREVEVSFKDYTGIILELVGKQRPVSPRYSLQATAGSLWQHLRENGSDTAFLKFFQITRPMFDIIARRMKRICPLRDPDVRNHRSGCQPQHDYKDLTAIGLRYFQVQSIEQLCMEFGCMDTVMYRDIQDVRESLHKVVLSIPQADVMYPNNEEAEEMYEVFCRKQGYTPDEVRPPFPIALAIDAMFTEGKTPSNQEEVAKRYSLHKGHGYKHIFMVNFYGEIVDYEIVCFGSMHDARAAINIVDRLRNPSFNKAKVGVVANAGFIGYATKKWTDKQASIYVPLTKRDKNKHWPEYEIQFSKWMVLARSMIEMFNGNFKETFPFLRKKVGMEDEKNFVIELETAIFLWNFRTRMIGFDQL